MGRDIGMNKLYCSGWHKPDSFLVKELGLCLQIGSTGRLIVSVKSNSYTRTDPTPAKNYHP